MIGKWQSKSAMGIFVLQFVLWRYTLQYYTIAHILACILTCLWSHTYCATVIVNLRQKKKIVLTLIVDNIATFNSQQKETKTSSQMCFKLARHFNGKRVLNIMLLLIWWKLMSFEMYESLYLSATARHLTQLFVVFKPDNKKQSS